MPTPDTNRAALRYFKEVTYGTVTGNPKFTNLRYTNESLGFDPTTIRTDTIRSDRQSDDVVRVDIGASGDVGFELACKEYDPFYEAVLFSPVFSADTTVVTSAVGLTLTFSFSSGNVLTRSTGSWITDFGAGSAAGLIGMWVLIAGANNAVNNGAFKIRSGSSATVLNLSGLTSFTAEVGDDNPVVTVRKLGTIVNGTTFSSWAFERDFTDSAPLFDLSLGNVAETLKLQVGTGGIIKGSFGFLVSTFASPPPTATSGDGSPNATQTTRFMNSVDHVSGMFSGVTQQTVTLDVTRFELNVKNNARQRKKIALLGVDSIGLGEFEVSGSIDLFSTSNAQYSKGLDHTDTALHLVTNDGTGNWLIFDIPRVKLGKPRRVVTGKNRDVLTTFDWQAFRDPVEGVTMRIARRQV